MPGCLSETLYQLSSKWQLTGGAQDVLLRRGFTEVRGVAQTVVLAFSVTLPQQGSVVSQQHHAPVRVSLRPRMPHDSYLTCSTVESLGLWALSQMGWLWFDSVPY